MLVFVVIARSVGLSEFGQYMYWFSATYLISLASNLGLGNMLLREVAIRQNELISIVSTALTVRLLISAVTLLLASFAALVAEQPELMLLLLVSNLLEALAETYFVAIRAVDRFFLEAKTVSAINVGQLLLIGVAAYIAPSVENFALAYLMGRLLQLFTILMVFNCAFGPITLTSIGAATSMAIRTRAYAIDFALGNLFGHIDSIVLRGLAGVSSVGVFQAGMRLFQGGAQLAPILANVFLPSAARSANDGKLSVQLVERLQLAFLISGAIGGIILAYWGEEIVRSLYGDAFTSLERLMPLFGLLFFVRFFAASWGVLLTATGHQTFRAAATATHLALALASGTLWVPTHSVEGWVQILVLANMFLGGAYLARAVSCKLARLSLTLAATPAIGCAVLAPKFW